jgi:hypothetical protein
LLERRRPTKVTDIDLESRQGLHISPASPLWVACAELFPLPEC